MDKSLSASITASRLLLKNQYAYLDGEGNYDALPAVSKKQEPAAHSPLHASIIAADRRSKEGPYAHLDGEGNFDALFVTPRPQPRAKRHGLSDELIKKYAEREAATPIKQRYSLIEIEQRARSLQASLWKDRELIWPGAVPTNLINVLDPSMALRLLGYDYELEETLGQFYSDGKLVEVAGTLRKSKRQVRISRQFSRTVCNFTTAHELGHALLHDTGASLHRDRPLDGSAVSRTTIEFEADKFASFFLMPKKLVQSVFERFFHTVLFTLNDATVFALGRGSYETLTNKCQSLRQLSCLLAGATHYNGVQFVSLADQFLVSNEAMAIRLEELGLVELH
jgi:hypothetical protein